MDNTFCGKTCIVTGASTGIGLALSLELLKRGAIVYMSAIEKCSADLSEFKDRASFEIVDVCDSEAVKNYIQKIVSKTNVDYMFANAGVGFSGSFLKVDKKTWDRVMGVNFFGIVHCVESILPAMIKQGYGHIVNTASVAAFLPVPYQSVYNASKHAVLGFTESLRYEFAPKNIKFSTICPGAVATPIWGKAYSTMKDEKGNQVMPDDTISAEQAAIEILQGVEKNQNIIPVNDYARLAYQSIQHNPDFNDQVMWELREKYSKLYED